MEHFSNEKFYLLENDNGNNRQSFQLAPKKRQIIKSRTIYTKYLKDTSYDLFNEIFKGMEFEDISGEKVKLNDYQEFYDFQIRLSSKYNPDIPFFDYEKKASVNILKEIPYKATRLRTLFGEEDGVNISPNGNFVRTSKRVNKNVSTLEHYNTVIGNSLILKGVYYYEIKILELGENTDMFFGIIAKNSEFINNDKYKYFPLSEFEDCYGFDLSDTFYSNKLPRNKGKKILSVGTIISIKVNLTTNKISIYFDGEKVKNNTIEIKNSNLGYYPAFSLSSGKEIQVRFGGIYNLFIYFQSANQIDAKPICQYNNLENIVSCYMKVIDNCLIKIINNKEITYIDSLQYFNPMINFFSKIAFNDEYIMKNYILKFMYKDYNENKEIDKYYDQRYNFLYLIINNIEKNKRRKNILLLLDCLCEEIKNDSFIFDSHDKMIKIVLYIKLYNYFLKKNQFKKILATNNVINEEVYKKIKMQLFIIFQPISICGISPNDVNSENIMNITKNKVNKFSNNKQYIECLSDLIETLLGLKLENYNNKIDKIHELIKMMKRENKKSKQDLVNNSVMIDNNNLNDIEMLEKYILNEKKENKVLENENNPPKFIKNRKLEYNPYTKIFFDLIKDNLEEKSDYNSYNIISTIFLPLLNLFNIYHEKENLSNYSNENFLSYLPVLCDNNSYFSSFSSKLLINENYLKNNKKQNSIKDIIDMNILSKELNEKEYNISSYLIGLLITLSSFYEKELFDINLYLQNRENKKILQSWKAKSKEKKINNYINNLKKLIFLVNENNIHIIKIALNILIPYFTDLLNNNFYLFLPFKFLNLLKFFIKLLSYHFLIFNDIKIVKNNNYKDNTSNKFFFHVLDNIKFMHNLISLVNENHNNHSSFEDLDDEINTSIDEDIKDFNYYFKERHLQNIIILLKNFYEKKENSNKYNLYKFLMYFNQDIISDNGYKENIFIPFIINNLKKDKNNFWFKSFIIEYLIKKKLIDFIKKTNNILRGDIEHIKAKDLRAIKYYFDAITLIVNFIRNFISHEIVLEKYFNYLCSEDSLEDNLANSTYIDKNKKDAGSFSIYCYLIYLASSIITELFNTNFINFCKKRIIFVVNNELQYKFLIRECFLFLGKVFLDIPQNYQIILNNKEKNKNKKEINNNNIINEENKNEKDKKQLDDDLKHYYYNIVNNIKVNDIFKLSSLVECYFIPRSDVEILRSYLRKFMIFLNELDIKYDLVPKNNNSKKNSQDNLCPICLDKQNDIHILPCNHTFCFECIKKVNDIRCPICRTNIIGVLEHPEFNFIESVRQQIRLSLQNMARELQNERNIIINRINIVRNRVNIANNRLNNIPGN